MLKRSVRCSRHARPSVRPYVRSSRLRRLSVRLRDRPPAARAAPQAAGALGDRMIDLRSRPADTSLMGSRGTCCWRCLANSSSSSSSSNNNNLIGGGMIELRGGPLLARPPPQLAGASERHQVELALRSRSERAPSRGGRRDSRWSTIAYRQLISSRRKVPLVAARRWHRKRPDQIRSVRRSCPGHRLHPLGLRRASPIGRWRRAS